MVRPTTSGRSGTTSARTGITAARTGITASRSLAAAVPDAPPPTGGGGGGGGGFYDGLTPTYVDWGTGAGWTTGDATTNVQNAITSAGSGTPTAPVVHRLALGQRYTLSTRVLLPTGAHDIGFEGRGTEEAWGQTGGGTLSTTATAATWTSAMISSTFNTASTTARAANIFCHGMTFEGTGSSSGEHQIGFLMFGVDGVLAAHCNYINLRGDGIALRDSSFEQLDNGYPTSDVMIRNCYFDLISRCTIAGIWSAGVTVQDNFLGRACVGSPASCLDIEPNLPRSVNSGWHIYRNQFGLASQTVTRHSFTLTRPQANGTGFLFTGDLWIEENNFSYAIPASSSYADIASSNGPITKTGTLRIVNNTRDANARPYPAAIVANHTGGGLIDGNTGFRSTPGTWVTLGSGNVGITVGTNT